MVSVSVYLLVGLAVSSTAGVLAVLVLFCAEVANKRQTSQLKTQLAALNSEKLAVERKFTELQNELGLVELKCNEARAEAETLRAERSRTEVRLRELNEASQQNGQTVAKARERGDRIRVRVLKAASEIRDVVARTESDLKGEM